MGKRNYTHVQALLPEIKSMLAEGKTQQEVEEYYGFSDKQVVKIYLHPYQNKVYCICLSGTSMTTALWLARPERNKR